MTCTSEYNGTHLNNPSVISHSLYKPGAPGPGTFLTALLVVSEGHVCSQLPDPLLPPFHIVCPINSCVWVEILTVRWTPLLTDFPTKLCAFLSKLSHSILCVKMCDLLMFVDETCALFTFSCIVFNWQYSYFRPCQHSVDLSLKGIGNRVKHWRQNTTVLEDHTFVSYFNTEFLIFGVPSQKLGTIFYVQGNRISDNKLIISTFKAFYSTAKWCILINGCVLLSAQSRLNRAAIRF